MDFWTDTDLCLLFVCPYRRLNVVLPTHHDQLRCGLRNRDVVVMLVGDDWENIQHYRELKIAPTGDWIDLAIGLDHRGQNRGWRSGWKTASRVIAAAVKPGASWGFRIDRESPDPQRPFLCWEPPRVVNRVPNHVPENSGTPIFTK